MPSIARRLHTLFSLPALVLAAGLWLLWQPSPPEWLRAADRGLFFAGLQLSPHWSNNADLALVELSPTQWQRFLDDPVSAGDMQELRDYLQRTSATVGLVADRLPRRDLHAAEQLLSRADSDSLLALEWQEYLQDWAALENWLASPQVVIGSDTLQANPDPAARVEASAAQWQRYYRWLPTGARPDYLRGVTNGDFSTGFHEPAVWPIQLSSPDFGALHQPLLWRQGEALYPDMALALLWQSRERPPVFWRQRSQLRLGTAEFRVGPDASLIPALQPDTRYAPRVTRLSPEALQRQVSHSSVLLVGQQGDPALMSLASKVQSLQMGMVYWTPWWHLALYKFLVALVLAYLLLLLPRLSLAVGVLSSGLILILLLVLQLGWQITQSQWLPLGSVILLLLAGHPLMVLWRSRRRHWQALARRLRHNACALAAQQLHQGQVEQALTTLAPCDTDKTVLQLLYDIGQHQERKRHFPAARRVYQNLQKRRRGYRDVTERLRHLDDLEQLPGQDGDLALTKTLALSDSHNRPLFGRYEVVRELGRGAMGVVYLGRDPQIDREVAIKTLSYARFDSDELPSVKMRFFREAEAAGKLSHPNIVTIYDVGEDHDLAFIAMDYLSGRPLSEYADPHRLLPVASVYRIVALVADALDYAHSQQVIHRDIKPGNIVYQPDSERVTVTDFGIARIASKARTQTGEIIGSPVYMSPEQLQGKKVGPASDIFSLGVTFYQLLCGELPFRGDNIAALSYKIINSRHPNVRELRPQLPASATRIVNKALQKDPARRYGNAAEMAGALHKALARGLEV